MPDHKTHIVIGTIVTAILLYLVHNFQDKIPFISIQLKGYDWIILSVIVYLFSQIPDIDADVSVINKIWNTVAGAIGIYSLFTGSLKLFGMLAISSIVGLEYVKHRGICHNEIFIACLAAPLVLINPFFAVVGFITGLSHIIADGDFIK